MPQCFIIVRCFKCSKFQSSIRRKDAKFNCKVCGEKQSVRKLYGTSFKNSDLRPIVQNLNLIEGTKQESQPNDIENRDNTHFEEEIEENVCATTQHNTRSRWDQFLESQPESDSEEDLDEEGYTMERPAYGKRQKFKRKTRGQTKKRKQTQPFSNESTTDADTVSKQVYHSSIHATNYENPLLRLASNSLELKNPAFGAPIPLTLDGIEDDSSSENEEYSNKRKLDSIPKNSIWREFI